MLVNGKNLTTIWFDVYEGLVKIIDQRLLPHKLKIVTLHTLSDVTYAIKEKFEKRIVRGNVTVNLLDQDEQPLYRDLAKKLKWHRGWKKGIRHVPESYGGDNYVAGDPVFVKDLEAIEKEYGIPSSEEFGFIAHGYKLGLSVQQTADLLKERKSK